MQDKLLIFLVFHFFANTATSARNETVFRWPGPIRIPFAAPYLSEGPVRIQLSDNVNIQRELRIREKVIVILDCSATVNATKQFLMEANLPLSFLQNITWYAQFYDRNGELSGIESVLTETTTGIIIYDIFGRYNEFLEADGSVVPSQEQVGGTASYRCELCYNGTNRCNSSRVFVNVIGDPPVVIVGGPDDFVKESSTEYNAVFGVDFCISRDQGSSGENIFLSITCSHNESFPVNPVPLASYLRNGAEITSGQRYVITSDNTLIGRSNLLLIFGDYTKSNEFNEVLGNYTCTLTNLYGTSSALTTITECCKATDFPNITTGPQFEDQPNENIILAGSSTCFGSNLKIQCLVSTALRNSTSFIWKKDGDRVNEFDSMTTITVQSTGVYTCCVQNRCGNNSATSYVLGSPVIDNGTGTLINENIKVGQNACLSAGKSLNISCQSTTPFTTVSWISTSDPSVVLGTSEVLTVSKSGTYQCTVLSSCGHVSAISRVNMLADVNITGAITGAGGCNRLKRAPDGVDLCPFIGDRLSLRCVTTDSNATVTLVPPGSSSSLIVTSVTTANSRSYTCAASNDCGTNNISYTVMVFNPARINRVSTLPPTNSMVTIIGAGRNTTNFEIATGRTVMLRCPTSGIEAPQTTWFRLNGTQLVPVSNSDLGVTVVNFMNDLILSIASYNDSFAGLYRCVTSNNAGDDTGDITLQNVQVISNVEWRASPWSKCSKLCGGGERTRNVTCVSTINSMIVDASLCDIKLMLHSFEYCNTDPCCDQDRHPYCKLLPGTDSCSKSEYKDVCCCTCNE